MTARLKCGVIGLGRMGQKYAEILAARLPQTELVAVCQRNAQRAEEAASTFGAKRFYTDYRDLLDDREVQAVVVAVNPQMHPQIVAAAATAGKDIYCEKPLALTLPEADETLATVKKAGVRLQLGLQRRHDPPYVEAMEKLQQGLIGEPVLFKATSRDPVGPSREYVPLSGGLLLDLCLHDFDLARWFMGAEVERVSAEGSALIYPFLQEFGDVDTVTVNLLFDNGAVGNVEGARKSTYGYDVRTEILGTEGGLMIGHLGYRPVLLLTEGGASYKTIPWFYERFDEAYFNELRDFVECLLADRTVTPSGEDGRAALEIALAAKKSLAEGRPVTIKS